MRRLVVVLLVLAVGAGCTFPNALGPSSDRAVAPLGHEGRWFTDSNGRVVMLRGVNFVQKWAPNTPEAAGFSDDDVALIAGSGFNTVRLGVVLEFLMPEPGQIDHDYLDSIARTVQILAKHGVYALLDFHQDGYGPVTHGNGMPAWATITDGLPNPEAPFPTYYIQNPALQRAFDNFWANKPGPDGVPLQEHYATAMRTVAARFVSSPNVIGYEAMNEPWPGTNWSSCVTGCPDLEQQLLAPFYARMTAAVRSVDTRRPVYVEPFVLFNFGSTDTVLPGNGSPNVLAPHVYALDPAANGSVMDRSVAAATRDGAPVVATEWGDSNDPAVLNPFVDQFDARLLPWLYWSWNGHIVMDSNQPLVPPNLDLFALAALSRPYPTVTNGTPTRLAFDSAAVTMDYEFSTARPGGYGTAHSVQTVITVPELRYPRGYKVTAVGADVTSAPCARAVTLRNRTGAASVSVHLAPANNCLH